MEMEAPKLRDLIEILDQIAPKQWAESWDNPGLQVGFLDQTIEKIVLSLDPSPQAVEYAAAQEAQLLLTHHPLIFKPLSNIRGNDYPGSVVYDAIRRGICIVAMHTNLDAAAEGINTILAGLLGLEKIEPLCPEKGGQEVRVEHGKKTSYKIGLGCIGDLSKPCSLSEFVQRTKKLLGLELLKLVGDTACTVKRVAVVGGSGGSLIKDAFFKGADLLVTGDVTYHQAREAEFLGLAVIDGGHFATERVAFRQFGKYLKKKISNDGWKIEVLFNDKETDPLIYI